MKSTSWATGLSVSGDGVGVVAHAGGVAVRLLAEQLGLTVLDEDGFRTLLEGGSV